MNLENNKKILNRILDGFQRGEKEAAIVALENYLKKNHNDILASYNLGVMYQETNRSEEAINQYLKVIKKDKRNWRALTNLGLLHFIKRMYKESNKFHFAVLRIKKDYQPALRDIGTNNLLLNNYEIAESFLTRSLKLNPVDYICLNSLGVIKMRIDKAEEAKKLFETAIKIKKNYYTSYNNLGLYYDRIGDKKNALLQYKECLKLNPSYPNALNNIGLIYFYYEENKKAYECFNKALKIDPEMIDLYFNMGDAYFKDRKFKEARDWYDKGFKIDSKSINGHYNLSFLLLALQKYEQAWIEYEYRLKKPAKIKEILHYKSIMKKIWNGTKIKKQKTLVIREQGAGDEILYSSMYKDFNILNNNVIFEADPRLITLFKRSLKVNLIPANKISNNKKALKDIDMTIFAGSLGRVCRNKKSDFPKTDKYLVPKKEISKKIKLRLNRINNNPKVGISWYSKNKRIGGGKSIKLMELFPILKLKEISFVNLQYDNHKKEIQEFTKKTNIKIIDLDDIDKFNDFESLASLLDSLDLLITVSNTTAHLAGAIGKKTWVMAPKNDSLLFYWNTGKASTPWYPNIKIYPKVDSWKQTIDKIEIDLKKWLKKFKT